MVLIENQPRFDEIKNYCELIDVDYDFVMDSLKKDIKSKVSLHSAVIDEKSIDSLIDAVDKKIDRSTRIWKKKILILLMKWESR